MPANDVSDEEIAREFQTLRNLRRRSASTPGPGALAIDPDLPPPSPGSRQSYHADTASVASYSSNDDITLSTPDGLDGDASGLFWVPAHLHPELAPGEFRAFLKAHTHSDPANADASDAGEAAGLSRSSSWLSRSSSSRRGTQDLGRKRSMLSRQYQPKLGDNVEEERPPVPLRDRMSVYGGREGEHGLTLEDLQKLEMVMDEADETDDPEEMRNILRRTLSMNKAPGFLQDEDDLGSGEMGVGGSPSIRPRPGSILQRSARTKIRKAGLAGDGGGHRFAATRKGRTTAAPTIDFPALYDDDGEPSVRPKSGNDGSEEGLHEGSFDSHEAKYQDGTQQTEDYDRRPSDASTDEAMIFDAYRQSRSSSTSSDSQDRSESPSREGSPPERKLSAPLLLPDIRTGSNAQDWSDLDSEKTPTQENVRDPIAGIRRPSPGAEYTEGRPAPPIGAMGGLSLQDQLNDERIPRSTSPTTISDSFTAVDLPPGMAPPPPRSSVPPGIAMQQQRAKEDGLSSSAERPPLGRADSAASSSSMSSIPSRDKEKDKEKKGGFFSKKDKKDKGKKEKDGLFGSLFGGSKKKVEDVSTVSNFSAAGPAAAAALLGTSKSAKSMGGPSPGPSPTSTAFSTFARYPIHVERAVYRLSHIKLANARRPLYEQVLISNLMFWYLGIIGRNGAEEKKPASANGKNEEEKEQKSIQKGTPPKPSDFGSAGKALVHPPPEQIQPTTPTKRMGLTKPDRRPDHARGRDAEAPMRTPSYGIQNAQVDSELRNANLMKPPSRPVQGSGSLQGHPQSQSHPSPHHKQQPPPNQQLSAPNFHPTQPQSFAPHQHNPQQPAPSQNLNPNSQRPPPQPAAQNPQHASQSPQHASQNPQRSLSPPMLGQPRPPNSGQPRPPTAGQSRPVPEAFAHPSIQAPPRGLPQSSFGPPPPVSASQQAQQALDGRDPRQRTMSHPGPPGQPVLGPQNAGMRRVVTDGRPHPPPEARSSQHVGPQPGQIFQYPGASGGPPPLGQPFPPRQALSPGAQPGQLYSGPQPGQVFHPRPPPPQYGGPMPLGPNPGARPLPDLNRGGPGPPLPPGAGPSTGGVQRFPTGPPPGMYRGPPNPADTFDPRRGPGPQTNMPHNHSLQQPIGMSPNHRPAGPGFYPAPRPGPQPGPGGPAPGQIFNPYPGGPPRPQRQGSGEEMHRRAQPVPQGGFTHHR